VLDALARRDAAALTALPGAQLDSGNSEIRNWIAAAGAVEHLSMTLVDYVPSYRSEAGTGVGMAFAVWD
jgi:3-O-methylgallate 3,4-dioxygenase